MIKKILAVFITVTMLIGLVPVSVSAADDISILSVKPDKTTAQPGDTITYTVTASAVSAWIGWQFSLGIPEGMTYVESSGTMNDEFVSLVMQTSDDVAEFDESSLSVLVINAYDVFAIESDIIMLTFKCTVDEDAVLGTYDISLNDLQGFTGEEDELSGDKYLPSVTSVTVEAAPCTHPAASLTHHDAVAATCTVSGSVEYYECTCGVKLGADKKVINDIVVPVLAHAMTKTDAVDATCTAAGNNEYYTCGICSNVFKDEAGETETTVEAETLAVIDHTWKAATCTEPETCSVCGAMEGEANGHDWEDATCTEPKTCLVCEATEGEANGHDWGEITNCEEARTCLREGCGETYPAGTHDWKAATCTEPKTCRVCGATEGAANGHDWEDATCTEPETCSVCGATEGEALGHDWEDATCTEPKTCLVCEATEGEALGHDWGEITNCEVERTCLREGCGETYPVGTHDWKAATCTEPKTCSVCGATEGEALGHDMIKIEAKEATCTEEGNNEFYNCRVCYKVFADEEGTRALSSLDVILPALGHDWSDWYQTKEPTEDEEGEERRDCSRCDAYETNVLDALGSPFMDEWYWTMVMLHNQKYEIEAEAFDGHISPAGVTRVKFAQSITYTITPDEGYEIEAVYVDGVDVGAVEEYTFKRVTKDHTITVVCAEIEEIAEEPVIDEVIGDSLYDDVDTGDWFCDAVEFVTEAGLMNGTGDGKFSPEVSTTRAMIVTILWRLEGEADAEPSAFTDVEDDMWYTAAIDWAAENGIVNGFEDGTFGPAKNITREQVMAILHRYAAYLGIADEAAVSMLPQYDCSVWAENDVNWADMNGLLDNLGVDVNDMTAEASRAEIAAYLTNFCGYIG